ncbi:hexokinase-domain-containing protein [Jimgerdemannia flammicorona]|uniref:Phosphotransferase n=1 Tax=Jimgerdemannia flammicorona TaxID=994334 RepID=A0A433D8K6_9FUNG|nr:hexokinase-domain-containing protein [Jimgerdemannia flammicorona]
MPSPTTDISAIDASFGCTDGQEQALQKIIAQFQLPVDKMRQIAKDMRTEMDKGLGQHTDAALRMIPSYLSEHPTGQETGVSYALELNGANIRILQVTFQGRGKISTRQQKFTASETLKHGDVRNLFDYLAECVGSFLTAMGTEETITMGFTFAFPVNQTAANHGTLITWTKGFEVTGAEGRDVVDLLQQSLRRKHLPVQVNALVNGTVGTLLAHNYKSLDTLLGCTFSNGTNCGKMCLRPNMQLDRETRNVDRYNDAIVIGRGNFHPPPSPAYYEKLEAIPKYDGPPTPSSEMIVNTEWGAFGDDHRSYLPLTRYDNALNRLSSNPGVHIYEKMVSGLYLGEILRQIVLDLVDRRLLFVGPGGQQELGRYSHEINTHNAFETSYAGQIEQDSTPELDDTRHILEAVLGLGEGATTLTDRKMVRRLCEVVGVRAARLCAAGISSVINKRGAVEGGVTISVDGTIFQHYPNFTSRVHEALRELYGNSVDLINIGTTRDGPGVGAALAAMLNTKRRTQTVAQ